MLKFRYLKSSASPVSQLYQISSGGVVDPWIATNQIVNRLSKTGRLNEAHMVFDGMPYKDEYAWNTLITGYVTWGRFDEALELFRRAPVRSSITWSSLISGYCKHGHGKEACELFSAMQLEGYRPSQYTLGSIIAISSESYDLERGECLHGFAIKSRLDKSIHVVTGLVDLYAKCNRMSKAEFLFQTVADRKHDATWTAILSGYAHNGENMAAIRVFVEMIAEGISPNQFTFLSVLTACASSLKCDVGVQVHAAVVKSGYAPSDFVQSALVGMYSKCQDINGAKRILEDVENDNTVSWNSMITECSRQGLHGEAILLFKSMQRKSMEIDHYTYAPVLNSFAAMDGDCVHSVIVKNGFTPCVLVSNALVDMYAKQGKFDHALKLFEQMTDKDVVSWTSLVTGYSYHHFYLEAAKLFCKMRVAGVSPDCMILASVLIGCAEMTIMEFGRQIHGFVIRYGVESSLRVGNSLVTIYAKCGSMVEARQVFDTMPARDVISWTALIIGYAQNGGGKDALAIYSEMIKAGIKPDFVTFVGLLFACSHGCLVEEAYGYFDTMQSEYGIEPGAEHYVCMIDLLSRAGRLPEAKKLIQEATVDPDGTVYTALLSACRVHGDVELGKTAATKLFELEPENAVPYIMLSNIYSNSGRWEEAASVRRLMNSKGVKKQPGCSWIEISARIHRFVCEESKHERIGEIYAKVDEVLGVIKMAGYVPDMKFSLHDVDEEGKEIGLAYHSEKLAVAFALIAVPETAPIRVFKNLRVCGDCHTAMKYISGVYRRNIILRDSNCFHHFREGGCSCGDYW